MWSKAAREKLEKELDICLDVFLYVLEFKANDVVRAAADNINDVMKELRDMIISSKSVDDDKDVSSIIKECRSKVVNQLQYICDNNVSSYNESFVHIKSKIHEYLNADNDTTTAKGGGGTSKKKKGKASQLELQQQRDDEKKLTVCYEKQAAVKQLSWDYQITVRFIQSFVIGKEHKDTILIDAFRNISNGYRDLYNFYAYEEEEEDKWYHLDVSRMIKEYKSKVEKELLQVCNKVSHPAVKQAFTRHLADVKAGTIPAQNHRPHLHNKDEKRMSTKQKMRFIQKKKRSRLLMRRRELISVKHKPPLFLDHHRHSQFCFKNNYFDRMYGHLRKSPPKEEEDSEPEFVECDDIDDV